MADTKASQSSIEQFDAYGISRFTTNGSSPSALLTCLQGVIWNPDNSVFRNPYNSELSVQQISNRIASSRLQCVPLSRWLMIAALFVDARKHLVHSLNQICRLINVPVVAVLVVTKTLHHLQRITRSVNRSTLPARLCSHGLPFVPGYRRGVILPGSAHDGSCRSMIRTSAFPRSTLHLCIQVKSSLRRSRPG